MAGGPKSKARDRRAPGRGGGRRGRTEPKRPDRWLAILAAAGVLLAAYLTVTKWVTSAAYCPSGAGCEIVQSSRYGALFGVPVAVFGLLFYGAILVVALRPMTATLRWGWVFPLAAGGVGASIVFTAVAWFVIGATCMWCLTSAALTVAILVLAAYRRPPIIPAGTWMVSGIAVLAVVTVIIGGYAASAPRPTTATPTGYEADLAQHLAKSGAKFYGAYWCPACQQQKRLFGAAAKLLPYIECDARDPAGQPQACAAAGVRVFPTWQIGGQRIEGVLPLEELARLTDFPPPPDGK